jgi:hypothetical protein
MLIKLPIKVNNRIFKETFILSSKNNEISLTEYKNNTIKKLVDIVYTNNFGIKTYPICFPLTFTIYNNYLINEYFFIFSLFLENYLETNNFLIILLNTINKHINKELTFIRLKKIKFNIIEPILKLINTKIAVNTNNLIYYYKKYQFYLNISLGIIFTQIDLNKIQLSKRIKSCINELFKLKFNFYGSNTTLINHINNIYNNEINLEKNKIINNYIYIKKKNSNSIYSSYIKEIKDIKNKILNNNYKLFYYPPKFKKKLIIKNIIIKLLDQNFTNNIFDIINKGNTFNNLILYIIYKNTDYLFDLTTNKIDYLCSDNISFFHFKKYIINKDFNIDIIKKLYVNYLHSFNYCRDNFSLHFKKILYYIYYFNEYINLNIKNQITTIIKNYKLKIIINCINQFYLKYKKENLNAVDNINLYSFSSINYIILLHFTDNNDFFVRNNYFKIIKTNFYSNCKLYQIYNQLEWVNIKYKLDYIKILNTNKENKLFFINKKFNKHQFKNISYNIISIIDNPFMMCNFLRKKKDFVKLTVYFSNNLNNIFFNNIKINKNQYDKIGHILYYLSHIKVQDITDGNYNIIITFLKKNSNLVFFNNKINININNLFTKSINLGILAKNIQNINIPIELNNIYDSSSNSTSDDTIDNSIEYSNEPSSLHINSRNYITIEESIEESTVNDYYNRNIKNKISKYMNKYYKYKKKYMETKL